MSIFPSIRPFMRAVKALELIAAALSYFAVEDARKNSRMFMPWARFSPVDRSELSHTDEKAIMDGRRQRAEIFLQRGYRGLEDAGDE